MNTLLQTGVFLDFDSLDQADLDRTRFNATIRDWRLLSNTASDEVSQAISNAEVVVTNKVVLDRSTILAAPHLKLICVSATGFNNVDIDAAKESGIVVSNVRHYATTSVVQHVFALILSLTNHLLRYRQDIQNGAWANSPHFSLLSHPIMELSGKKLGIIGYGELGQAVARMGVHFGMQPLIAARANEAVPAGRVAFEQVLEEADVISLHCPLTDATRGLIGAAQLRLMKSDAIIINAARGGIVDESALLDALQRGQIGGAGIDVLTEEPPIHGNVLLNQTLTNLIITPHIAWASLASRQRLLDEIAMNIEAFNKGSPRNQV